MSRPALGTLVQNVKAPNGASSVCSVADPATGLFLLHTVLTRPAHSTLGKREPLEDGVMVDVAALLIDRYKVRSHGLQLPSLWVIPTAAVS